MGFISTNIIDSCIKKTKDFLFPINKKLWLKLGLIVLLVGTGSSGFPNLNLNLGKWPVDQSVWQFISNYFIWIVAFFLIFLFIGFVINLLRILFNFVLIDTVEQRKCFIGKSLSKNGGLAISYFIFSTIVYLFFMIISMIVFAPVIIKIVADPENFSLEAVGSYLVFAIPLILIIFLVWSLFGWALYNLVMLDMHLKKIKALKSWKRMWRLAVKEIKEVIIYLLLKFVLGVAAAVISAIVVLILLFILIILAAILVIFGILLAALIPAISIFMIILGILFGIVVFILFIYSMAVVLSPIAVFFTNYRLDFYKNLSERNKGLLVSIK
jgi:hypothetical protein